MHPPIFHIFVVKKTGYKSEKRSWLFQITYLSVNIGWGPSSEKWTRSRKESVSGRFLISRKTKIYTKNNRMKLKKWENTNFDWPCLQHGPCNMGNTEINEVLKVLYISSDNLLPFFISYPLAESKNLELYSN